MKKRILLLGATGMAGHVAYYYLKATEKYDITNVVFRRKLTDDSIILDITDEIAVEKLIKKTNPDIILNCVGVLIKGSQLHSDNAIYINAYFPHLLERLSAENGAKLIHISTDCVFSGLKGDYLETDIRDADDVYGRSKALGEIINEKDLTIRTSIIGPELKSDGEGLFHWLMNQEGTINGYTEVFWGGVTTLELVKAIDWSIDKDIKGLFHLTNGTKITKYALLQLIKEIWNINNILILPNEDKKSDKSLLKSEWIDYQVPSYVQMLNDLHKWMLEKKELYVYFE